MLLVVKDVVELIEAMMRRLDVAISAASDSRSCRSFESGLCPPHQCQQLFFVRDCRMLGKRRRSVLVAPSKKRTKSSSAIEEIAFDFGAREDYLSGFHKRKLQRIKHAREEASKKEREEKIMARKMVRE